MRRLLLGFFLLLVTIYSRGQQAPREDLARYEEINLRLGKFSDRYRQGTTLLIIGASITTLAAVIAPGKPSPAFVITGAVFSCAGVVLHIDANKFLNNKRQFWR